MATRISTAGVELDWSRIGASVAADPIGLALVFVAGFAPQDPLHDAAHDTRRAFPCH